jgi:uncharacterized protein
MTSIRVRQFKEFELEGGTVIEAIPSVGLVSTIASTYLISTLGLDQVAALDSDDFPPLSMIYSKKPKFPARVYADPSRRVAVFICEIPLAAPLHRPLARALLEWSEDHKASRIIGLEGLPLPETPNAAHEAKLWAVGSTDHSRETLTKAGFQQLETGMISGVSGVLLNEGRFKDFDVIAMLAEARQDMPDALAASKLVEGVDILMPEFEIDLGPLLEQAKVLESHLQALQQQATPAVKAHSDLIYR